MSGQVIFFEKNIIDLSMSAVTLTVTDAIATNTGQDIVNFIRNRNNSSAWLTTESTDAANTELLAEWGDSESIDAIILVKHNFKSFIVEVSTDGIAWENVLTETVNTKNTSFIEMTDKTANRARITIHGTFVVDDDKILHQLIITRKIGEGRLDGYPVIKSPLFDRRKKISKMLSGKINVTESVGGFSCTLAVENWKNNNDLTIIESIYFNRAGVLMSLSGFMEEQFSSKRYGYRNEDLYFVRPTNDWQPEWYKGLYQSGMVVSLDLEECLN